MASNLRIFSGTSHPALASAVADNLGVKVSEMRIDRFACGEIYAKPVESIRGDDVYLIQTGSASVNEDLVELFIMLDSMKRSFAGKIHVVIPHFPYARQDRVAEPREPISSRLMAHLIEEAGADHVVCVELHSDQIQGFFDKPMDNINVRGLFAEYFGKLSVDNDMVVVSPDVGGAKNAKKFADNLNAGLAVLHKSRPAHNVAEATHLVGDVKGKTCIVYDDMIDTAGSVLSAKKALDAADAGPDIYLAATHAVFSDPAYERLAEASYKEVVVTDTVPVKRSFDGLTVLSVAPMLARAIDCIHNKKSITSGLA